MKYRAAGCTDASGISGALLGVAALERLAGSRVPGRFGERVLRIVKGCTDADEQPKPPWRTRKEQYIAGLASMPADVLLVSSADKLYDHRRTQALYHLSVRVGGGAREQVGWVMDAALMAFPRPDRASTTKHSGPEDRR